MTRRPLAHDTGIDLCPDPSRVLARPFIPGLEDVGPTGSRAGAVIDRVMQLDDDQVQQTLDDVMERFAHRHRGIQRLFAANADRVLPLVTAGAPVSGARRLLIGAYFTHEYAIEGAALANPSMVPHPIQGSDGSLRFVMSVRCIGEGHRSAIGFRTGMIDAGGSVSVNQPSHYVTYESGEPGIHSRRVFHARLDQLGHDFDELSHLLALLPATFDDGELNAALTTLGDGSPRISPDLASHAAGLTQWSYRVGFPDDTDVSERILWPHAPPEYHGMEDARFVRFVEDDGSCRYLATYTAFDRSTISLQLLETTDFQHFASSPVSGAAAMGKGLALFPRRIGGHFAALTRSDRETNSLALSDDLRHWTATTVLQVPHEPWELIQLGNCGSPIETAQGWVVLTHGVGPMRTYSMGALLLDLDDPTIVLGRTIMPLLTPTAGHREGYVPNVVYSCGALAHGDTLVIPFGIADQRIGIATVSLEELLAQLREDGR
jgi:predicted GH43/DUF377 family glycosyl hydrolase